ncbi:myosin heavy chain-like [Gossypium australe]|uniref:Myosin heavy chain-like n=1 Tax=Gossypium australe TaxID=47621 RepID=A0A5B6W906_9ROSI|nr:myosin heavy chain-like [Gossypium australe]
MATLQNLQDEDIEWRAPWMILDEILYRCGDFNWVPLLGIWGAVGYAPLLMLRQYRSRQFIPATQGLAQCEFLYKVNDNIPMPNQEVIRPLKEHLQVIPSVLEIIRQDFEKRNLELGKKIEQLEEEKMQLGLDVGVQKLEANKLRKGKNKAEEDLDGLKMNYKKLHLSMRTARLGKTSEQWSNEQWKEQLHHSQVQADMLSLKYESELDRGQELARLLRKVKALSIRAKLYIIDAKDLSLVPDLVLPPKFKTPEFEKYNRTSCPKAHITVFYRRMTGYANNDQLLIHCFQDSLIGSAVKWYNQLSHAKVNSWKDLAQAFMKQYSHVTDMTPERITLQNMEKKQNESFKQYA